MAEMTVEELKLRIAEQKKENESLKAKNTELEESNKKLQDDYQDLQRTNNKLFMMIDNPEPKDNEGEPKEETPEEHRQNVEDTLYDSIMKGGK